MFRLQEHHLHLPHFSVDMNHNMRVLYVVRFLRDLVNKLTTFFVPIFIYQTATAGSFNYLLSGSDVRKGILAISLFYIICGITSLTSLLPIARLGKRFGHTTLLFVSHVLFAIFLLLLFFSQTNHWLVFAAAVVEGVQISFFWPSYFTLITKSAAKKHLGEDLGLIQFLLRLASLISPAIGGTIAVFFGFDTLFLTGMLFVAFTAIATSFMKPEPEHDRVSLSEFREWMREAAFKSLALSYIGRYVNDAVYVLWPVYIFVLLGAVDSVGYLHTLSLFLAMLITFVGSMSIDHSKSKKPFVLSGVALSFLWLLRAQIISFWHIAIIDTVDKLTSNFYWLAYDSRFMKRGKGSQAFSYFMYREIIIQMAVIVFWSILALLFWLIEFDWNTLFVVAAIGVLISLLVNESRPRQK
jgi:MFS family permease